MIPFENGHIRRLDDLDVFEKKVFVRADLNTPMLDGQITDDKRIQAILPTLDYLLDAQARVIIASHLGRPKSPKDTRFSMLPVADRLSEYVDQPVVFSEDCVGDGVGHLIQNTKNKLIVLENLRFDPGEKNCDPAFIQALAAPIDVYVNDAFGTLHRQHASITGLPEKTYEKGIGFLIEKELYHLNKLLDQPKKPFAVILGGAKVSDKIQVLEHLVKKIDRLFIGGAMAFTFLKAKGIPIGNSLFEEDMVPYAQKIMDVAKKRNVDIFLPRDFQIARSLEDGHHDVTPTEHIPDGMMGLDIGPKTMLFFESHLQNVHTLFWNGPMGVFEKKPFDQGTLGLAQAIAKIDCLKIIGGGDSASAIEQSKLSDQMSHVSTGGGAALEFLRNPSLPGLKALKYFSAPA